MSITSVIKAIKNDLKVFVSDMISWFIPAHMKRAMYLITLYHYMLDDPANEKIDELEKLNEALYLAKTDAKSLIFPGFFTKKIWRGDGGSLLRLPEAELKQNIIMRTPCWLRYGRSADLENDLVSLRRFILQHNEGA